jgi:hypothetical protein
MVYISHAHLRQDPLQDLEKFSLIDRIEASSDINFNKIKLGTDRASERLALVYFGAGVLTWSRTYPASVS